MASVVIVFSGGDVAGERSAELHIESDAPLTRAQIADQVEGLVDQLATQAGYKTTLEAHQPYLYSFEVESVFEF